MKNQNVSTMKSNQKVQIIMCYVQTLQSATDTVLPELLGYWSWCNALINGTVDSCLENKDLVTLKQLIPLNNQFAVMLWRFQSAKVLDAEDAAPMAQEIDERTRKIWTGFRDMDPTNADAHAGLAMFELRRKNLALAEEHLRAGMKLNRTMNFLQVQGEWAKETGRSAEFLKELESAVKLYPDSLPLLKLFAETAVAAKRRDLAIEAIQKMSSAGPSTPMLYWAEAGLWLEAGDASKALGLLRKVPKTDLTKNANLARAYAHALIEAKEEKELRDFARTVDENGDRAKDPDLALAPVLGMLDAAVTLEQLDQISELANKVMQRWPRSTPALRARAEAMARACELSTPRWEDGRVRTSIDMLETYKGREPGDLWATGKIAWLRLKGQKNIPLAFSEASALRAAEQNGTLNDENLVILGAIYLAKLQYDDAIRCLTRGARTLRHPSVAYLHLAMAYRGKGDTRNARVALGQAQSFLQSDRDRDDYKATAQLFQE
jgi:tetratricopeptide (TPR) repeat protein